eukprot:scaffold5259_cov58-Attheya_sp.AAC.3
MVVWTAIRVALQWGLCPVTFLTVAAAAGIRRPVAGARRFASRPAGFVAVPPGSLKRERSTALLAKNLNDENTIDDLVGSALNRAIRTLSTKSDATSPTSRTVPQFTIGQALAPPQPQTQPQTRTDTTNNGYLTNPCVTPTALAHSLWRETISPHVDTVIDATCGNGKDAVALASMLFPHNSEPSLHRNPQLICIDIQAQACQNTHANLKNVMNHDLFMNHVRIVQRSHAHLSDLVDRDDDSSTVGLVAYNLGYLPGSTETQAILTQVETTIQSLVEAVFLVRSDRGLISILTYPGSNLEEANAVSALVEGLSLLTSKSIDWRDHLQNQTKLELSDGIRQLVLDSLERIEQEGDKRQTWRAFEHRPLGRPLSPILLTAMRIK